MEHFLLKLVPIIYNFSGKTLLETSFTSEIKSRKIQGREIRNGSRDSIRYKCDNGNLNYVVS